MEEKKESKLKEMYEGKIWINNHNTMLIKIPNELKDHPDFKLNNQRTVAVIPTKTGIEIKNLIVE